MTALDVLQRCSLFRDFSETGLQIFASIAVDRTVPAGTPVFAEGMVGESMYVVKEGTVRVTLRDGQGERTLAMLGPSEPFGEIALLTRSTRLVSVVAETTCDLLELAQRDFYRLQPQKPQACLKLALAIAGDLARKAADAREDLRALAGGQG
ncbi:MAG: cyclic nucleotide-binding domain-containing protein [Deltaproteobacteria bacterium]